MFIKSGFGCGLQLGGPRVWVATQKLLGPVLGLVLDPIPKRDSQLEKDVKALVGCGLAQEDGRMCLSNGSPSALGPFLSPCLDVFIQKEEPLP